MAIKRAMGLLVFAWCFFYLAKSCFAYDIQPYDAQQATDKPGEALSLVFCSLNYKHAADFAKDREMLIQRLKITPPFNENNKFKFWYINLSQKEEGEVFKPTSVFPPFKVRQDLLADISAKLKGAYKLVIIDAQGSIACAELSEIRKTSLVILGRKALNNDHSFAKGFLHEFGHSLGLRDECVNCQQLSSSGYPNCAASQEEAEAWWGDLVGKELRVNYIGGCCGNKNYIRPTIASLMNDPNKAEDFGPVNERYLQFPPLPSPPHKGEGNVNDVSLA